MTYFDYKLESFVIEKDLSKKNYLMELTIRNHVNQKGISVFNLTQLETDVLQQINITLPDLMQFYEKNRKNPTYFFQFKLKAYDGPQQIIVFRPYFCPPDETMLIQQWRDVLTELLEEYHVIALTQITLTILGIKD